ncbi:unnamed protein product [Heterosigma akashiwo]
MEGRGRMFEDHSFPANNSSLYRNPSFVPEYDVDEGSIKWMRPGDYSQDPDYFKDGVSAGDVIQGRLGDCWLLGAMAAVAAHGNGDLVENMFNSNMEDFKRYGVYTCRFYKNGEWQEVVADTRAPCTRVAEDGGGGGGKSRYAFHPAYGRCRDLNEQWVVLLEKAYAKLHGTYEALNGGSIAEALVDLTGGSAEKILLTEDKARRTRTAAAAARGIKLMVEDGRLWAKMLNYMRWGYLLCCSMSDNEAEMEAEDESGIIKNHAYTILDATEAGGFHFVRVRNPWGRGEWKGDWSDRSTWWDDYPEILQASASISMHSLWYRDEMDGTFWITFEDFCAHYNKIYVCRLFPDEKFRQYCIHGEWAGKTAGGEHKVATEGGVPEMQATRDSLMKGGGLMKSHWGWMPDSDPYWFNNPQYRITTNQATDCYVSLMQQDRRAASQLRENYPIAFEVIKMRKNPDHPRAWEKDPDQLAADSNAANFSSRFPQREVAKGNVALEPGYSYNVVPHASHKGKEGRFVLRVFSRIALKVERLPETHTAYLPGAWERTSNRDTAGGPLRVFDDKAGGRDNPRWCQNPQYWITLPPGAEASVDIKLVLRRTEGAGRRVPPAGGQGEGRAGAGGRGDGGGKDDQQAKIGLVVYRCRVLHEGAARQRRPERRERRWEPLPAKESSLRNPRWGPGRTDEAKDKDLFPDRKMSVGPGEWCQMSGNTPGRGWPRPRCGGW